MALPQLTAGIIKQAFIASVLANYTSCVIHVIDVHFSYIPTASQDLPLILSSIGDDGVDETSFKREFTRQRLQNLDCFLGALMVNGFVLNRKSKDAINRLLSHAYSVGLPVASDAVIYPETFIMFDGRMNDGTHWTSPPIDTDQFLKIIRPENLPSVFVLPSSVNEIKDGVWATGWTVCMHCGNDKLKSFDCTDGSQCVKAMQRTYEIITDEGRNVQWLINSWPIKYVINSTAKEAFCPFNLTIKKSIAPNKDDCYISELELIAGFVFSGSNWTAISSQKDVVDYPVVQQGNTQASAEKTGPTISLTPAGGSELESPEDLNMTVYGNKSASRGPRLTPSRNSSSLSISVEQNGSNAIYEGPILSMEKGSGHGGVSIVVDGGSTSSNGSGVIVIAPDGMNGVTLGRNEVEKLPSITHQTVFRTLGKVQVVWTGSSGGVKFITSDSVTSPRDNSLNSFTQPLDRKIWILILISTLGVMFLFPDSKGKYESFLKNAVNMAGMLVEQSTVNQSPKAHLWFKLRTLFLLTWVLPVMVIINSYRSLFQSNFIIEPSYFTTWTRLSDIKHFRIFFVFELSEHSVCSDETTLASIWESRCCTDSFGVNWKETDRGFCFAAQLMWNFSHAHTANVHLTDADWDNLDACHETLWYLLKENLRVLCTEDLTAAIRNELTKPQTAFVTDKSHLAAEWLHFEEYMKSSRIKFAAPPEGLNVPHGYTYPTGLSRYHLKLVPAKLKTLMHSGVYSLWKKWEQLRREFQLRKAMRGLTKEVKDCEPLSLDGSDIYLVFHALGIGFGLCFMCFTAEIVSYFYQVKTEADRRRTLLYKP